MTEAATRIPVKAKVLQKDSLFDEGFLFIVIGLGNVFNLFFQIFMSRNLGPDNFSALSALLALLFIVSQPIVTIQTTITKFIAHFSAIGESGKVRRLFMECLKRVSLVAFILTAMTLVSTPAIRDYLNIRTNGPVIMTGFLLFFTYIMPVFWAVLQGCEKFRFLGLSYLVSFSSKCALGILFALIGWGVDGVLFGIILSLPLAFLAGFPPIRKVLAVSGMSEEVDLKPLYRFSLPVVTALLLLSLYCQLDVALVRHFFGETSKGLLSAGYYAYASIVGKGFFFLPLGITLVIFPKVARKKALGENPLPVLKRWLFIEIGLSLLGIVATIILSRYIALILGKTDAPELIGLIKMFSVAITPIGATTILVNYNLANERYFFLWFLLPFTLMTFGVIWFYHVTPLSVLLTMAAGGFSLFIFIFIFTFLPAKVKKPLSETSAIS